MTLGSILGRNHPVHYGELIKSLSAVGTTLHRTVIIIYLLINSHWKPSGPKPEQYPGMNICLGRISYEDDGGS